MSATISEQAIQTLEVLKDEQILAPIDIVFETLLEQMGPLNQRADGVPMPMKLEAWPGGRWYRELGANDGHLWGFVQSIKAPTLLEIQGPLFMSAPVMSHVLYRLTEEPGGTRLKFSHRAVGQIGPEFQDGSRIREGWGHIISRIHEYAVSKAKEAK